VTNPIGTAPASTRTDTYRWALEPDEAAQEVINEIAFYRKTIKNSILYPRWVRAFRNKHGLADAQTGEASALSRRGSRGHRASLRSSVAAVDARHQLSIVAPVIPALDAIPVNSAYKTLAQVSEGKRFFDYYVQRKGVGRLFYKCADNQQVFGISWIVTDWDAFGGQALEAPGSQAPAQMNAQPQTAEEVAAGPDAPGPDEGQVAGGEQVQDARQTAGDLEFHVHTPLDLVIDTCQDGEHDWFISRDKTSRWELCERYPGMKDKILGLESVVEDDQWTSNDFRVDGFGKDKGTDLVAVWTLHHRKTRALPQGRMLRVVSADCWLFNGAYPYEDLSISAMVADPIWNSAFGDSTYHHALGIQQALDRALSATVTNVLATGHQLVAIQNENFELQELSDGVSAICTKGGPGEEPPRGISLLTTQEEHHRTIDKLESLTHNCMGVNSVIRGEPDSNVKSGAFAGLLVQQAAQFNSPAQFGFQRCVEDVGNKMLAVLKRFADHPIQGEISGPNGQWRLKEFTKDDYSGIHRLVAKPGNPAEQTAVFKKSKADAMLEAGLITSKQEYETMIETNSSEMATEDGEAEDLCILQENETMQALADGKQPDGGVAVPAPPMGPPPMPGELPPPQVVCPPVLATDNDALHIKKHAGLLNSPQARGNPQRVSIVGAHNAWHMQNLTSKPPLLASILGQMPPPPPPGAPPPGAEPPPGKGPPGKGLNGVQAVRPVKQLVPPPEATPPGH
jgi:hypothetical protein